MQPAEIYRQHRQLFGSVPDDSLPYVCKQCVGPVNVGHFSCASCDRVFPHRELSMALSRRVIPMTAVLSPSTWYTYLATYKRGHPEYGQVLAALADLFLQAHHQRLAKLLGGEPTALTLVPPSAASRSAACH